MAIKPESRVRVLRDISRAENPQYACAGETGTVLEVFASNPSKRYRRWNAKVLVTRPEGPVCLTFRLTSLAEI